MSIPSVRDLYYSPLCDTNLKAYIGFLYKCNEHGKRVVAVGNNNGGAGGTRCNGGSVGVGICADGVSVDTDAAEDNSKESVVGSNVVCDDKHGDINSSIKEGKTGGVGSSGLASGVDGNVRCCVHGGVCDDASSNGVSNSKGRSGSVVDSLGVEVDGAKERKVNVPGAFGNSCNEEGPSVSLGSNVLRNRQWRKEKKERKARRRGSDHLTRCWRNEAANGWQVKDGDQKVDEELKKTSTAKWKAQNELAAERARRDLEVLKANDVMDEVKRYRTKVNAATEKNMVSIEKTHATLRATGNVVGEFHGSAETVLTPDLSSGTISPDSSASMHEFRAVQKKNLDLENENEILKKKLALVTEKTGVSGQYIDLYEKDIWTNNSVNDAILDEMYPCGYGADGTYCEKGKSRIIPTY